MDAKTEPATSVQANPLVDIVIPTRGRGQLITTTISTILKSRQPDFTLWIVDQSDDDATRKAVEPFVTQDSRVKYVNTPTQGSNIARNMGIAAGSAPYILFTDDDCSVADDWVDNMLQELTQEGAWAVFGRIIPQQQSPPTSRAASEDEAALHKQLPMALQDRPARQVYQGNRFNLGFGHGANMGLSRQHNDLIGGFDNLLGAGGLLRSWPERDLGYRMLRRGGRIIYTPTAVVYHRHWRSWPEVKNTYRNYGAGAGAVVAKFIRCGDLAALYLLLEWVVDQGIRAIASGLFKQRSKEKIITGYYQLIYPWVGLIQSLRYPIDREQLIYRSEEYDKA